MKLLDRKDARSSAKRENDVLIESNIRLREYHGEITTKLNTIKESYDPDKLKLLRDFENYSKEIQVKKDVVLGELNTITKMVEDKKEILYGLVAKSDDLIEKEYLINEENKKLSLREVFVQDLELKWKLKQK